MEFTIYSLSSWFTFGLYSLWFLLAIVLACYIPSAVMLKKIFSKQTQFEKFIIYTSLGLILWAMQGAIFGYLHLRFLSYVYLLVFFILWKPGRLLKRTSYRLPEIKIKKTGLILLLLFLVGIFGQTNRFIPTGFMFPKGVYIFTGTADDAFWHAALTNAIVRRFPPFEPGLVGAAVTNYHYWSNLVNAELVRVFHLPLLTVQFTFSSILASFLLGGLVYTLARMLKFSEPGVFIAVYLQYFASDVIYLVSFVTTRIFEFRVHPLEDGTMFWENPPRALSFIATLLGLILLKKYVQTKNFKLGMLLAVVLGSVIGFKVHTGVMIVAATSALALYFLLKRDWQTVGLCIVAVVVSAAIYVPVNRGSGLPVLSLFEMPRMFVVQDKLHLSFLELRWETYAEHHNIVRVWEMNLVMLAIFFLGQFGIRNVGWVGLRQSCKTLGTPVFIFLFAGVSGSTIVGSLFIQPIAWADIFNSYLAASLLLSIFAAITLNRWVSNKNVVLKALLIFLLAAVTIPRWMYKTNIDLKSVARAAPQVTRDELSAMNFIRTNTDKKSILWVMNAGQWDSIFPYVSILTDRDMFLSGQSILERHGIPFGDRASASRMLLTSNNPSAVAELLKKNHIEYLYFYGNPTLPQGLAGAPLRKIFGNDNNTIYKFIGL